MEYWRRGRRVNKLLISVPILQYSITPFLMNILRPEQILAAPPAPYQSNYYAMYSSAFGGIVTDPRVMLVPMDDHLVHRGDGVFETVKLVRSRIYMLREHIARLFASADRISLKAPGTADEIAGIIRETARASGQTDALIRILLSRGPGSLGVNPYDCPSPGLYVMVHKLLPSFMDAHPGGARVRSSAIPVKPGFFANAKTCNYLPNVLMKKEAVDAGVDFTISFDERGHVAEGATENIGVLTKRRELLVPKVDRILAGTTMLRVLDLAREKLLGPYLDLVDHAELNRKHLHQAAEVFIFGTTPDVTAVVEFDGKPIGKGKPGPIFGMLGDLLRRDILEGSGHHVEV
jgi:branched-subunit amino acid aminotransferase/4-amino-4-deoxychorismate lyase